MISKIKNKIKQIENRLEVTRQLQEDNLALTQILKMFGDHLFLPLTSWSISPREVLHYCNDIIINDRKSIIEFGSGFSTICIAQLLKINKKDAVFISVESDANWASQLTTILSGLELSDYVKIVVAPIAEVDVRFAKLSQQKWYSTKILAEHIDVLDNIDLVIVDGPFGGLTPFSRYSALPFLIDKMSKKFAVFLDDSGREHEKQIVIDWQRMLNADVIEYNKRYTCLSNNGNFDVSPYSIKTIL